jgi:hypothetical protein
VAFTVLFCSMSSDRRANAGFLEVAFDAFVSESYGGDRDDLVPYGAAVISKKLTENAAGTSGGMESGQSRRSHSVFQEALMAQDSIEDDYSKSQKVAGIGNFAAATVLWVAGVLTVFQGISVLSDDQLIVPLPDYVFGFNATAWGWIHIIWVS